MEKRELSNILSKIFLPLGFKKKGYYWVLNDENITKMINLQKSQFAESFYINYGYILKNIPLDGMMHVHYRLSSPGVKERNRIKELLDLGNEIPNELRTNELTGKISEEIVYNMNNINSEVDLLNELQRRPNLNNIPLVVKNYFNL